MLHILPVSCFQTFQRTLSFVAPGRCSLKADAKVRTSGQRAKLFKGFFQHGAKFFGIVDRKEKEHIIILGGGGRNRRLGKLRGLADRANKTNKANEPNWTK